MAGLGGPPGGAGWTTNTSWQTVQRIVLPTICS
jgi:hypothetical protein